MGVVMRDRSLREIDPEVADAVLHETERQATGIELIASENFVSEAVLETMGSVFTNKYAEGYPGRRYYGGCEYADVVERLARDRAKQLFDAEFANVQPHSGSQAKTFSALALSGVVRSKIIAVIRIIAALPKIDAHHEHRCS